MEENIRAQKTNWFGWGFFFLICAGVIAALGALLISNVMPFSWLAQQLKQPEQINGSPDVASSLPVTEPASQAAVQNISKIGISDNSPVNNDKKVENNDKKGKKSATPMPAILRDRFGCPQGMEFVSGGRTLMGSVSSDPQREDTDKNAVSVDVKPYCIDQYEYPNTASSMPQASVSFAQAKATCSKLGKRLCSEEEWERACKGQQGLRFPYGDVYQAGVCVVAAEKALASGQSRQCVSSFDVYDLSGNIGEWTDSILGNGQAIAKGGHALSTSLQSRCAHRQFVPMRSQETWLGFRCCSDPE